MSSTSDVPVIAYYLPQFHAIPENDAWWGTGFTEWTNVRKSEPLFEGHLQPYGPSIDLGHYDLSDQRILKAQFELARTNGIDAFCFYHYWFDGKRLLNTPVDQFLESDTEGHFCLSWANENWTRRWDGKEHEILIAQRYDVNTADAVFDSFLPALKDRRYFRLEERLVLLVHRVDHIPNASKVAHRWRARAREEGLGELLLIASETTFGLDPSSYGFDAVAEFPPVGANDFSVAWRTPARGLIDGFDGRLMSYRRLAQRYMKRKDAKFVRYRGITPSWDNTPRRGAKATVFVGSTPALFGAWAASSLRKEAQRQGSGMLFVNAWNEWAEGAVLEDSEAYGLSYLEAIRGGAPTHSEPKSVPVLGRWSVGFTKSLALTMAGTTKHTVQRLVMRVRRILKGTGAKSLGPTD